LSLSSDRCQEPNQYRVTPAPSLSLMRRPLFSNLTWCNSAP
jgi:hypothetical protein